MKYVNIYSYPRLTSRKHWTTFRSIWASIERSSSFCRWIFRYRVNCDHFFTKPLRSNAKSNSSLRFFPFSTDHPWRKRKLAVKQALPFRPLTLSYFSLRVGRRVYSYFLFVSCPGLLFKLSVDISPWKRWLQTRSEQLWWGGGGREHESQFRACSLCILIDAASERDKWFSWLDAFHGVKLFQDPKRWEPCFLLIYWYDKMIFRPYRCVHLWQDFLKWNEYNFLRYQLFTSRHNE